MQGAMDRLERFVSGRRRLILGVWVALLVISAPLAARQTASLTGGGFEVPGSESKAVSEALASIPGAQSETLAIVFDNRRAGPAARLAAVEKVANDGFEDVDGVRATPEALQAARDSTEPIFVMPLEVTASRDDSVDEAAQIRLNLDVDSEGAAVPLHIVGQGGLWAGMQELSKQDLEQAELFGLPIVLAILLAVFGSLPAAALPLALGVAAVTVTGAIVFLLAQVMEMSIFVTNMASMLGIGVAVDYSLFILARYREELRGGRSPAQARAAAMRTSGLAVTFSGATVVVALAGLFLIDAKVADSMAVGAIVVVAVAVLAAVTLLPALIALLGHRVSEPGKIIGRLRPKRRERTGPGFWERWTNALMKRPLPFAIGAAGLMLLIALPGLSLQLGTGAIPQFPKGFETRDGFELAAQAPGGAGALGPIQLIADFGDRPVDQPALEAVPPQLAKVSGIADITGPYVSRDGRRGLFIITPTYAAEDDRTIALVETIRDIDGSAGATLLVGGPTAQNTDFSDLVQGSLWKVAVFVVVLSLLVLLLALRSIVLPIKAVLMNVLSVAAAYGVLVMVFQYGWFDGIFGYDSLGYVQALTPALLLAIVFGLSMDYEVFMLSRIKERFQATGDNRKAVGQGLAASAATITSAALIMVAVFTIFAFTGVPQIKEIGVGLAVAIFLDATVVRLVLVPATMELLGDRNWWLPEWLDRRLPDVEFEAGQPSNAPPAVAAR
jgi:RND superfamily putative drug exporter